MGVYGSISNTSDCDRFLNVTAIECEQNLKIMWNVMGIVPIMVFFIVYRMLGGFERDEDNELSDNIETENNVRPRRLSILVRILLALKLAKVQESK